MLSFNFAPIEYKTGCMMWLNPFIFLYRALVVAICSVVFLLCWTIALTFGIVYSVLIGIGMIPISLISFVSEMYCAAKERWGKKLT